jgi:RNA polymerase sigma-70 factor (ECF subfamily)
MEDYMSAVSNGKKSLNAPSDRDLVVQAREKDREAFGELVRRHHSSCIRFAMSLLRDRGEAEEEVQNAFWKAFEHLDQYKGTAEFSSWLLRIVANHCLMRLRLRARARMLYLDGDNGREGEGAIELPSTTPDPECGLIRTQMSSLLQREIRRIPKLLRNVVLLRDVQQLPMADVARQLGISIPAAKSRLFRARTELRHRVLQCCGAHGQYMPRSNVLDLPARSTRCPLAHA